MYIILLLILNFYKNLNHVYDRYCITVFLPKYTSYRSYVYKIRMRSKVPQYKFKHFSSRPHPLKVKTYDWMIKMIKFHVCENQYQMTNLHPPYFFSLINHFIFCLSPPLISTRSIDLLCCISTHVEHEREHPCRLQHIAHWYENNDIVSKTLIMNAVQILESSFASFSRLFFLTQRCLDEIPEDAVDRNCWLHFSSAQCPWPLKCTHFH